MFNILLLPQQQKQPPLPGRRQKQPIHQLSFIPPPTRLPILHQLIFNPPPPTRLLLLHQLFSILPERLWPLHQLFSILTERLRLLHQLFSILPDRPWSLYQLFFIHHHFLLVVPLCNFHVSFLQSALKLPNLQCDRSYSLVLGIHKHW